MNVKTIVADRECRVGFCEIKKFSVAFALVTSVASASWAQTAPPPPVQQPPGQGEQKGNALSGPRKQLATIVFAGLGGAVLGLSTLSFYGRPQDNLRNIAIGFAMGIMVGTMLVTYKATTNPQELYGGVAPMPNSERALAAFSEGPLHPVPENVPLQASWKFNF